jgi:hypothetical protein
MDDMVQNLCDCILEQASKPQYQDKFKARVLAPCIHYLGERIYPYVLALSGVVTVMLLLLVVILIKKTQINATSG